MSGKVAGKEKTAGSKTDLPYKDLQIVVAHLPRAIYIIHANKSDNVCAGVVELVDTRDLKSLAP